MNKKIRAFVIFLAILLLAGAGAFYYLQQRDGIVSKGQGQSIDEVLKNSIDISDLITNLKSANYVKMSFKIQTDSKSAKDELTKREFQVRNIMIEVLSDTKQEDLQGKAGKIKLENKLKDRINQIMQDGKVVEVYITDSLLQ